MAHDLLDEARLRRLIEVGRGIVAQLDLEGVLRRVLAEARDMTGARYAALGILDADRASLERFIPLGIDEAGSAAIGDLPRGRGVLGELIADPEPLRLADVSSHPRACGFPAGHPPMRTFMGIPILVRGQAYGNLYLTDKEGGREFDAADEEAVTTLAEWAAVAIFNVRLYERSEKERRALSRAVHTQEATTEIARAVGGETDRGRVLETVAKRCRALAGASSLLVLLHEGDACRVVATAGECGKGPLGAAVEPRVADAAGAVLAAREAGVEAEAALVVPMRFRGTELGALVALDRIEHGREFDEEDRRLLAAAAASAATAMATLRSVTADRMRHALRAAEGERSRWARELHDSVLQGMGSRRLLLSGALKRASRAEVDEAVGEALAGITGDIEELRALITELRPAALDQLGLDAALRGLGERAAPDGGPAVRVDVSIEDRRLDPELETAAYRFAQEALNNVLKHAKAENATLWARIESGRLEIDVGDDGRGFDLDGIHDGYGLPGMRERVELAEGVLRMRSEPGEGTSLRATFPLDPGSGLDQAAGEGGADQLGAGRDA